MLRKSLGWWAITALLVILLHLLGCNRYVPVITLNIAALGLTICDSQGRPAVIVHPALSGTPERDYVLVHEGEHIKQARRYGCKQMMGRYVRDSVFRYRMEAEAYCAQAEARIKDGADRNSTIESLVNYMQQYYRAAETTEQVRKELPCKGVYHENGMETHGTYHLSQPP